MFNLALLAKHPKSMVAKVLSAKYFPKVGFLESQFGQRPSFAWRSIWNPKILLKKGLMWQVGAGENICIWRDKWLPNILIHGTSSPSYLANANATVNELINQDTNWWNIPVIESIFLASVVAQICGMAIAQCSQHDRLRWSGTKNGEYSVRSTYHLGLESRSNELGSYSMPVTANPFWKLLWKLNVPRVVHLFLWRGCNNIVPTKENLYHRKVVSEPFCPQCGVEVETSGHFLWRCAMSTAVWAECSRRIQKCTIANGDFLAIFHELSSRLEVSEL
jgi:hypothetical protein